MLLHKKYKIDFSNRIWVVTIGIFCYLLGLLSNEQDYFEKIISIISLIFTAIGLYIANKALNTWQHQFKYEQKYNDLKNLEAAYIKRLRIFREYYYAYLAAARKGVPPEKTIDLKESIASQKACVKYRDAWRVASSSLSSESENSFNFNPDKVDSYLITLLKSIHKTYDNNYRPEKAMIEEKLDSYWKDGLCAIRALRGNYS